MSPVSTIHSRVVYDALTACGIRLLSALPETWLVHLIRLAEEDPDMIVRTARRKRAWASPPARTWPGCGRRC
ncbi:MAG: hypothetical protein R2712_30610 [Vicinamibacterales bacterium]